jgi:hypothetical protein
MRSASLPSAAVGGEGAGGGDGQPPTTTWWLGDQTVTWDRYDGLASAVTGLMSASVSGLYPQHSDIGGYTAVQIGPNGDVLNVTRSCELLMRWAEFAAFTSIFRTHLGEHRPPGGGGVVVPYGGCAQPLQELCVCAHHGPSRVHVVMHPPPLPPPPRGPTHARRLRQPSPDHPAPGDSHLPPPPPHCMLQEPCPPAAAR